uniref:Ras family n=1 Tax=Mimiviridae sp. ChoanoV1 TaxID=2596887 RepID=A0A5B8INT5_9VIRU|nr:Ras family [Mimiviridae sp. ChoanoV1]
MLKKITNHYNDAYEEINIVNKNIKKPPSFNKSIKCVIVGDSAVGKTSIINTYNKRNNEYNESTLGATYWELCYDFDKNLRAKINFWDTAGQERYNALIPMYVRDCDIIIITFDLTNINTFNSLKKWYNFINNFYNTPEIIIVGNKVDLEIYRVVTSKDIQKFVNENFKNKPAVFETSSLNNVNIDELFKHIFSITKKIINERLKNKLRDEKLSNSYNNYQDRSKYKCCSLM